MKTLSINLVPLSLLGELPPCHSQDMQTLE